MALYRFLRTSVLRSGRRARPEGAGIALSLAAIAATALLTGCAASQEVPVAPAPADRAEACDAQRAQQWVGQQASSALGARLLALTGARVLRWVPPRTAVTMDFRADRLTVSYNDNLAIDRIACG